MLAYCPTAYRGTLRPCPEDRFNFSETENLYIEGDNLEVLKLLQTSYYNKVKMIYIDPPYNTGKDFIYKDKFGDSIANYKELTSHTTKRNPEHMGKYHTNWLNMMYPRLKLAHSLLKEDGVIFISIDDNEVFNLKKLCDEVFGEENFISQRCFINHIPNGTNKGYIARGHEYIIAYTKSIDYLKPFFRHGNVDSISEERCTNAPTIKNPTSIIKFKKGLSYQGDDKIITGYIGNKEPIEIIGEMKFENGKLINDVELKSSWINKSQLEQYMENGIAYDENGQDVYDIYFSIDGKPKYRKKLKFLSPKSVQQFKNSDADKFSNIYFNNPRPINLIDFFIKLCSNEDDIILDFFSGSATTAHAVMQLNKEDGGNRKYIMVQLPELCDEKREAYKAGYKNICEIGKERIRRAGKHLVEDMDDPTTLDIGFKVLKLDTSNITEWDNSLIDSTLDKAKQVEMLLERMEHSLKGIKADRRKLDVIFEVMMNLGVPFHIPLTQTEINGKPMYVVGDFLLLICLESEITFEDVKAMCDEAPAMLVCGVNGFDDSCVMANIYYYLQEVEIELKLI